MTGWVWGSTRFFIDDAIQELLALSPGYVAALGFRRVLVWRRADGALVYAAESGGRPRGGWLDDAADRLLLRTGGAIVEIDLGAGTRRERPPLEGDPQAPAIAYDRVGGGARITWPDGHVLSVSYPGELVAGIACAGELVAVPHGRAIDVVDRAGAVRGSFAGFDLAALSPCGREVALASRASKRVFFGEVETGAVDLPELPVWRIDALQLSPDRSRLLVVAGGHAWLLDPETGQTRVQLERCPSPPLLGRSVIDEAARFVAGGRLVAGQAGQRVVRWDAASGAVERAMAGPERWRAEVASFDARGERVAVRGARYPGGLMFVPDDEVRVWDLSRGREVAAIVEEDLDAGIELSPDGRELALVTDEGARLVALPAGPGGPVEVRVLAEFAGFQREGLRARRHADGLVVEQLARGAVVARHPRDGGMSFSACPEGQTFAVGYPDGRIAVCGADGRELATLTAAGPVGALALGPGRVFAAGWDCTVHALDW